MAYSGCDEMTDWSDDAIDWYASEHGEADALTRTLIDMAVYAFHAATLDIGCGTGAALRYAHDRFNSGTLVGLDLPRMIDHARAASEGYDITFVAGTAEALPFPDEHFNLVLALNAIHHWQDQEKGLSEAARVLKPSGVLVIGGERFGTDILPDGQDYEAAMAAVGVPVHRAIDAEGGGFFTYGRKQSDV